MCDELDTEDMTQTEFDNVMRILLGNPPLDEEPTIWADDKEENP